MMPESDLEFLRDRSLAALRYLAFVERVKLAAQAALVVLTVGVCAWLAAILLTAKR